MKRSSRYVEAAIQRCVEAGPRTWARWLAEGSTWLEELEGDEAGPSARLFISAGMAAIVSGLQDRVESQEERLLLNVFSALFLSDEEVC
jgi:hypothetical protein